MGRIDRSFRLLSASLHVLRRDTELMALPAIAGLMTILIGASFFAAAWGSGLAERQVSGGHYVLLGLFYFCAYFLGIFANASVVAAASMRLEGQDPTVRDGVRIAAQKVGTILVWSAIAMTVGVGLRMLEERAGILGRIFISLLGTAWTVITFFVVPVILFEPGGVGYAIKRSAKLFKQRWGETLVGTVGLGFAMFILSIPVVLVAVLLGMASLPIGIAFAIVAFSVLMVIGATLSGIFNAALYRFATTGEAQGPFTIPDLRGNFLSRSGRRLGGGFTGI